MSTEYTPSTHTQAVTAEIVERMIARDMDWIDLAHDADIGPIALGNRLEGKAPWDVDQVYEIARALGVSVWALLNPADAIA